MGEGTDKFSGVCGHSRHPEEEDQVEISGIIGDGVILQHDNATLHASRMTERKIEDLLCEVFTHPANSPDLTPLDYHLFPALKKFLGEKWFANDEELKTTNHLTMDE